MSFHVLPPRQPSFTKVAPPILARVDPDYLRDDFEKDILTLDAPTFLPCGSVVPCVYGPYSAPSLSIAYRGGRV